MAHHDKARDHFFDGAAITLAYLPGSTRTGRTD
jgi:hypothetical protein